MTRQTDPRSPSPRRRPVRLQRRDHGVWNTVATYATIDAAETALARHDEARPGVYRVTAPRAWILDRNDVHGWDDLRSGRLSERAAVRGGAR